MKTDTFALNSPLHLKAWHHSWKDASVPAPRRFPAHIAPCRTREEAEPTAAAHRGNVDLQTYNRGHLVCRDVKIHSEHEEAILTKRGAAPGNWEHFLSDFCSLSVRNSHLERQRPHQTHPGSSPERSEGPLSCPWAGLTGFLQVWKARTIVHILLKLKGNLSDR